MACTTSNTIYYNIRELPQIFNIENGDLILVETDTGTNILDFENLIIDLDHTTFGDTIVQNTSDINELSSKSPRWDNTATTVAANSASWAEQPPIPVFEQTIPSYAYKMTTAVTKYSGNYRYRRNEPATPPDPVVGLSAALSCAYTDSYVRADFTVSSVFTYANTPFVTFTLLSADLDSDNWEEMTPFVDFEKYENEFKNLSGPLTVTFARTTFPPGIVTGAGWNHNAHSSVLFKLNSSGVKVQVGYRAITGRGTFLVNVLGNSYLSLQEVLDNGYINSDVDQTV